MYNLILDFVESKIEGFVRPEIIFDEEFTYGVESRNISVPVNYTCSIEQHAWWKRFMLKYLMLEHGLFLTEKDDYTFSLLHEIGHYITLEGIPADTIYQSYSADMRKIKQNVTAYEYEKGYREIRIERMADLWAIDFIETYPEVLEICNMNII
jgi:hypothetical protein